MPTVKDDYVDVAAKRVEEMVDWNSRGGVGAQKAMKTLSRNYRIPFGTLWALRYRPPKGIFWDIVENIRLAYEAECRRQALKISQRIQDIAGEQGDEVAEALERKVGHLLRRENVPLQYGGPGAGHGFPGT